MAGTTPRWYLKQAGASFLNLPNDEEVAVNLNEGPFGDFNFAIWVREAWDSNFKGLASFPVYSSDMAILSEILDTGNLWNTGTPTWRELYNGEKDYPGPDGMITGTQACVQRFNDWLSTHTTYEAEAATREAWWKGAVLGWCQPRLIAALEGWEREEPPADPPAPEVRFPPQSKTAIAGPLGLAIAMGSLTKLEMVDNVPTLTVIPTPQ